MKVTMELEEYNDLMAYKEKIEFLGIGELSKKEIERMKEKYNLIDIIKRNIKLEEKQNHINGIKELEIILKEQMIRDLFDLDISLKIDGKNIFVNKENSKIKIVKSIL